MPTVICDETGEEVEVQPVHAVAVSANAAQGASDGPRLSKVQVELIQQSMANAVTWCYQEGITDPDAIKAKMQEARANIKKRIEEAMEADRKATIEAINRG